MSGQLDIFGRSAVLDAALAELASADAVDLGAVYTQPHLVERILDLCGFVGHALHEKRVLEPAVGGGAFLFPVLSRVLASAETAGHHPNEWPDVLRNQIRAVEVHSDTFNDLKLKLITFLEDAGATPAVAEDLAQSWLVRDDFLLTDELGEFDLVVGNPPYVRQERIAAELLNEYRRRFDTLYDRADLYVLFYEKCLSMLTPHGVLGFLCANRWIKNKYGGPLRAMVDRDYQLVHYLDLTGQDVFDRVVDAYPAVTVIIRNDHPESDGVTNIHRYGETAIARVPRVGNARDPWLLDSPVVLGVIRALEASYPSLEEAGIQVGIGVATGCDRVFIGSRDQLDIEDSRLLPLAMAGDIHAGVVNWSERFLANPWDVDGLVVLKDHPRFAKFLMSHKDVVAKRHVAKRDPAKWYKTIDRVDVTLTAKPKLLIPDIKGDLTMGYDPGHYYPHHNLYHLTSAQWDMRWIQALLKSSLAVSFVGAYGVKMAGGFLRFQAQYLRRIRVLEMNNLTSKDRAQLTELCDAPREEVDRFVFSLYGLDRVEQEIISKFARELTGDV